MHEGSKPVRLLCLLAAIILCCGLLIQPAGAIWHNILAEHFSGSWQDWPWGNWMIDPPPGVPYSWGIQDYIFYPYSLFPQSIWCVGSPNILDPEFDPYPANVDSWAFWGPIDLSEAVAARASFYYYCDCEMVVDYLQWGAADAFNAYEADHVSGWNVSGNWYYSFVDFDSLEEGAVSLIGQSDVYLFFHFYSNWNAIAGMGAFIDEVNVTWDDGFTDLEAQSASVAELDSTQISGGAVGDTVIFCVNWIAQGSGTTADFDIRCWLDGSPFYTERRNVAFNGDPIVWETTYTDTTWVVTPGTHTVSWMLDAADEIREPDENNNDTLVTFTGNIPPWIEIVTPAWGDTAASDFLITWDDGDPDDDASISLYYYIDSLGTTMWGIAGAYNLSEDDTTNSFLWDISLIPEGMYWVFGKITDGVSTIIDVSNGPLVIDRTPPPNVPPTITLTHPTAGDTTVTDFSITWEDEDPDDNAIISLYWDVMGSGYDGELIVSDIYEDDLQDNYLWDVTSIPEDLVWVYASIADDDTTILVYSPGPLVINDTPPSITITHPAPGDTAVDQFIITWLDDDPDDNATISLYWDDDGSGYDGTPIPGAEALEEDALADSFDWDLSSMSPGSFWVYALIADEDTTVQAYSSGPLIITTAQGIRGGFEFGSVPTDYTLDSVYPNPFNSSTTVRIGLPGSSEVTVRVYDSLGRLCEELLSGQLQAGYHEVSWSPGHLPSGIYLVELATPNGNQRAKVVFLK